MPRALDEIDYCNTLKLFKENMRAIVIVVRGKYGLRILWSVEGSEIQDDWEAVCKKRLGSCVA